VLRVSTYVQSDCHVIECAIDLLWQELCLLCLFGRLFVYVVSSIVVNFFGRCGLLALLDT